MIDLPDLNYKIYGDDMQLVEIYLEKNSSVMAEPGAMLYMGPNINMQTQSGGIWNGLKRIFSGESFFITSFMNTGNKKDRVAFAAPFPGKIVPLDLKQIGGEFLCQKDSFLCAEENTDIDIAFTKKIGSGLFGGEGFILQRLKGMGKAFIHAGGTVIEKTLGPGETLKLDTGCLVGFMPSIDYDIKFVGGFKNALFGGEGLFLVKLRGPGKIYLQSLPFSRLADRIAKAAIKPRGEIKRGSGILGNIFSGDAGF